MSQNKKPNESQFPLTPIAAAVAGVIVAPADAIAQDQAESYELEEVIVTATKIDANIQHIPSSVQAVPEAMLKELGAQTTADYTRFMPAVNWISFNAGSNAVIFRGINTTTSGYTGTQSSSVYLDEIPITATNGSSPDVRMLDVARVEALSGPQGTLFGAAAQAGTLRIITNKPDTSHFEASAEVILATGSTSDLSHSVTGVFNIPLVEDVFAVRLAVQAAEDGGFIDNVLGHTPDTWYGNTAAENCAGGAAGPRPSQFACNRLEWGSYRNDNVAEENWNSAASILYRISARWDINENWSATLAYHAGELDSQGSNAYNPFVGDLETIGFRKNESHSEWDMTALTIEADLGFAQFVSATSFYENQRTYHIDNTLYYKYYTTRPYCADNGVWADLGAQYTPQYFYYWLWENPANGRAVYAPLYCTIAASNPSGDVAQMPEVIGLGRGPEWQERFTQEFRLSHQGETVDWLAGLYYEDSNDSWNSIWMHEANIPYQDTMSYLFIQDCYNAPVGSPLWKMWQCNPNGTYGILGGPDDVGAALADADHYWDSRDDTDWETKAIFGELTWHITDQWNATVGGRWFDTKNTKTYIKYTAGSTNSKGRAVGGFMQPRWYGNHLPQSGTISEFVPKFSIDYHIDSDKMVYATYTEGYRTGGVNRANKNADWNRTLWGQVWDPDRLKNYEAGLRSRWADNTVQLNLTFFYQDWTEFQHEVVDPSSGECLVPSDPWPGCPQGELPWISIVGNVGDAHSSGIQAELDWAPADNWRVGGNFLMLEAEIDSTTADERSGLHKGMPLPNIPEFTGSAWATYTWPVEFIAGGEMFIRGQASYTGETHSTLIPADPKTPTPTFTNDSYTIADLRIGLTSSDASWQIDLFVINITDERAQISQGGSSGSYQWGRTGEYEHAHYVYTVRPREYGIRFSSRWGN